MKPSFNKLEKCHQLSRNREERWSGVQTYVFTIHKDSRKSWCPKFAKNIWKSKLWKSLMICKRLIMAGKIY